MATFQKRGKKWRVMVRKTGRAPITKSFSTKALGEAWARDIEREIESGEYDQARVLGSTSFGSLVDRYREEMPTPGRTKDACLRMLQRGLGDLTLDRLTKPAILAYCRRRSIEDGAGPATVSQDLIYLGTVLTVARAHWDLPVRLEAVSDARAVLRREGRVGRSEERERRPTAEELAALEEYWQRPVVKRTLTTPIIDVVRFAIASAMRLSEIVAIRWEDLNETDRTILIRDRKHPTKKQGNNQTVPLLGDAWTIVQRQPRSPDGRIFPFKAASISASFTRAVLRTRIDDLHFHDLRREGISRLFEAGYQIQEVALVSGHRDWKQLKRYTQIEAKDLHRDPP